MHPWIHRFLAAALAATTTTAPQHREVAPPAEAQGVLGSWQVWVILLAVSVLSGLAIKLVSDPPRQD